MGDVAKTRASLVVKGLGSRRRKRSDSGLAPADGGAGPSACPPAIRESMPRVVPSVGPAFGAISVAGGQKYMEDAVAIKTDLCSPAINGCRPVHYFGVFDGHGGSHFSIMCQENLHGILKEELMSLTKVRPNQIGEESVLQEIWRNAISRVFSRMELLALHTCLCGSVGFRCNCNRRRDAVSYSGTTAVVVVLTEKHVVVGNCGDSRAVLYRRGEDNIVPLTFDHKPDEAKEKARIEATGGRVINLDAARVNGILAMSRAIGDKYLKPFVISEPEVTFTRRDKEDEFLIIATDGMWDVIPIPMAGQVARQCLKDRRNFNLDLNSTPPSDEESSELCLRSASAAALLTRLAVARKSSDNISVVVVDLERD